MYLKSKTGEVLHILEWEEQLDKFWGTFERSSKEQPLCYKLPRRPVNAWERYSKIMGLEII